MGELKIKITLPPILKSLLYDLIKQNIRPILVGGCIRDHYLNRPCKDYDIELYGLNDLDSIKSTLSKYGSVKLTGKSFGVLKLVTQEYDFDFSLPRTETKIGLGHQAFSIKTHSHIDFAQASKRRDFCINAMGYDVQSDTFLDPYKGHHDIHTGTLRHIHDETFVEDPLRVYRAIQFCARFNFRLHDTTFQLCQYIIQRGELTSLAQERVFEEIKKLFLNSPQPSIGLILLKQLGLTDLFPILKKPLEDRKLLMGLNHIDAIAHHPINNPLHKLIITLSALHHHTPYTQIEPLLSQLTHQKELIQTVLLLVPYNTVSLLEAYKNNMISYIKKLSTDIPIHLLSMLYLTNPQKSQQEKEAMGWVVAKAKEIGIYTQPLKPLITGRDLLELGFTSGPLFKTLLDYAYTLQIEQSYPDKNLLLDTILHQFHHHLKSHYA